MIQLIPLNKRGTKFYLSYIDLNDLKKINDEKGHKTGDFYIKIFAECVLSQIRSGDSLFRIGGDEFILLSKEMSGDHFNEFNKRLKEKCEENHISYAIGTADHDLLKNNSPEELIKLADKKMYNDKRAIKINSPSKFTFLKEEYL
jgi:diguanylate cyclase (GGDEF)-like protein